MKPFALKMARAYDPATQTASVIAQDRLLEVRLCDECAYLVGLQHEGHQVNGHDGVTLCTDCAMDFVPAIEDTPRYRAQMKAGDRTARTDGRSEVAALVDSITRT